MKIKHSNPNYIVNFDLISAYIPSLKEAYADKDYTTLEASLHLSIEDRFVEEAYLLYQKFNTDIKYVFVVGIGGSNLGTQAIFKAVDGIYADTFTEKTRFIFLDTISALLLTEAKQIVEKKLNSKEDFLVILISKSGKTTESIGNFEILAEILAEKFKHIEDRVVAITDKNSDFDTLAQSKNIARLNLPKNVGGRFSVFSNVGLFPLFFYFTKAEVLSLLEGARNIMDEFFANPKESIATVSASAQYLEYQNGIKIHNTFFFNENLEFLGKWYRQLMGESIGKKMDKDEKEKRHGITPIVSIGSTDLHSMAQLYFGGPKDKFTTLVRIKDNSNNIKVNTQIFGKLVPAIDQKSTDHIMDAIYKGVVGAYEANQIPFLEIELEDCGLKEIGKFLQFKMLEIMLLGFMMNVNTFDQPSVEDYKIITKKYL